MKPIMFYQRLQALGQLVVVATRLAIPIRLLWQHTATHGLSHAQLSERRLRWTRDKGYLIQPLVLMKHGAGTSRYAYHLLMLEMVLVAAWLWFLLRMQIVLLLTLLQTSTVFGQDIC